jgi:histidine triad (HIT) family protein
MCVFCAIARGEIEAHTVFEDACCIAFLDHRPLFAGHSLLVPKEHYETLTDLPADLVTPLFSAARLIATAMEKVLGAHGSFVAINNKVSQSVAHVHVHVVPRRRKDGLRGFFWPRTSYADESEMAVIAAKLRRGVEELSGSGS